MAYSSPAFLLKSIDYGENDRILTFFTQKEGKIKGIAKGAKKSQRRFGGALDWFHLVKLHYRSPKKEGADFFFFDSMDMIHRCETIAQNLTAYAYGSYFLELVRELTHDHQAEEMVFDLLYGALSKLESVSKEEHTEKQGVENIARFFELNLLDLLGLKPVLDRCVECQKTLVIQGKNFDTRTFQFCLQRSGLVCQTCHEAKRNLKYMSFVGLQGKAIKRMQEAFSYAGQDVQDAISLPEFDEVSNRQARKLLTQYIQHYAQKPMATLAFLDGLGN